MNGRTSDRDRDKSSRTFGRRQGRPLRASLKALLAARLPELEVRLPEPPAQLDPATLFPHLAARSGAGEFWLEIGFGAGEHLAWQAARHRAVGFLGAEVFLNGIAALVRQIDAEALDNVRIYQGDGRDLLDALPDRSLSRVFLLFADPWPKARHHKRRFVQHATLDRLAAVIRSGGELRVATDHMEYLEWILEHLSAHQAFIPLAQGPEEWRQRPADWPETRYERKAIERGARPAYLRFRRR